MTREEYLKALIKEYGSQREFAKYVGIPHSTLFSILKNVGGASIDNIIKICKGLGISADDLAKMPGDEDVQKGYYTNPDTAEFAEYLRTRPGARMLFSAAKDITKEEMEETVRYIEFLKSKHK